MFSEGGALIPGDEAHRLGQRRCVTAEFAAAAIVRAVRASEDPERAAVRIGHACPRRVPRVLTAEATEALAEGVITVWVRRTWGLGELTLRQARPRDP